VDSLWIVAEAVQNKSSPAPGIAVSLSAWFSNESVSENHMAKAKPNLHSDKGHFSGHKFDTSKYIVLNFGVSRNMKTGQLMARDAKGSKPKK
jgi:hypothetical protein